jgi:hypothetical protein
VKEIWEETGAGRGEAILGARGAGSAGLYEDAGCDVADGDEGDDEGTQETRGVPSQRSRCQRRKKNCNLSSLLQEAQAAADVAVEEAWAAREVEESADDQDILIQVRRPLGRRKWSHDEMRGVRVERRNGYSNETACAVFIASGTQYRAHSYPMHRPLVLPEG